MNTFRIHSENGELIALKSKWMYRLRSSALHQQKIQTTCAKRFNFWKLFKLIFTCFALMFMSRRMYDECIRCNWWKKKLSCPKTHALFKQNLLLAGSIHFSCVLHYLWMTKSYHDKSNKTEILICSCYRFGWNMLIQHFLSTFCFVYLFWFLYNRKCIFFPGIHVTGSEFYTGE